MHIYIYIVSFLYIMVGAIIAFLYTLRGGKIHKAIPLGWGLCILGALCASCIFPSIPDFTKSHHYVQFFPEGIIVPPIVIFGWFHIAVVVAVAGVLRQIIIHFRPQSKFFGANPVRKKTRLYLYIGSFYLLLPIVMLFFFIIGSADKWRNGRTYLLYKTDHKALLEACRELSSKISPGIPAPRGFRLDFIDSPIPGVGTFPKIITSLNSESIMFFPDGIVDIKMSFNVSYGVVALPENYIFQKNSKEASLGEKLYNISSLTIELIEGLRYYDNDFEKHPERKKEIEELLRKNK